MNEIVSASAETVVRCLLIGSVAAGVLVPLAWLVTRTTRLRTPVHRHAIWLYCLIGVVVLPALCLYGPKLTLPVLAARSRISAVPVGPPARAQPMQPIEWTGLSPAPQTAAVPLPHDSPAALVPSTLPLPAPTSSAIAVSWKVALTGVWLAGSALMLARLVVGWLRLRSIRRRTTPIEPGALAAELSGRRLEIRLTEQLPGPVCLGLLKPVVLLPQQMYEGASAKDLGMILAHEMAHIDRRDCWVNLFQRLLEAVFFFHPLVWLASRQLTHERERICDNWVLARGVRVDDYLHLLTEIGERILMKPTHLSAVALFEGGLLSRVRSLLDPPHNRITCMTRRSAWTCALSFVLCFAALGTIRLGARPNPDVSATPAATALLVGSGSIQAASVDTSFRPQEETLGPTGRRPDGNCSLGGRVISDLTGEPLDHATVYLFRIATHDAIFIKVAGDGTYLFENIAAGEYAMRTTHTTGYQDVSYNPEGRTGNLLRFTLQDGEHRTDVVLRPKPACSISGVVLDENGKPLAGGELEVVAWQETDEINSLGTRFRIAARTAGPIKTDGSYLLDGLDARPTYVMAIDRRAQDKDDPYPPCYYPGTFDRNQAKLVSFEPAFAAWNIDIRLRKHGEYALEGTITDESTGTPIENALVAVHHADMLFDDVTAYTDAQGRYRIDSLAPGAFLVHVDAKPFGFVRKRYPLTIATESKESRLDFALKPGVTLRGKFVDTAGEAMEFDRPAYGYAYHHPQLNPQSGSWSGRCNRYTVAERIAPIFFEPGAGDYEGEPMNFPTAGTFIIEGLLPGQTTLSFEPKAGDLVVQSILYQGRDITVAGFDTGTDREIQDITIVIARVAAPARRQ